MTTLPPYPAYKDSGVPWLGRIPAHWEMGRLKSHARNVVELTGERAGEEIYLALEHVESWTGRLRPSAPDASFDSQVKRFRANDVLFGKLRPYLAKVTRPEQDGVCVGEFLVLRPQTPYFTSCYLEQLLRSKPVIDAINSSTFGAKMPRADWQFVGNMAVSLPPLPEQHAITRYLDHMDRRIRRLVRAKQRLIALLEEQKQAIIHQAVTRGLDPAVRLKPSGVAWLGDVPEHWEIRRNGLLFAQRNETGYAELPILEVSLRTGVNVREFSDSTRKQVMSDRGSYKRAVQGDLAYNMMRMWQGAVGLAPVDGLVSPAYVVARPLGDIDPRYFVSQFRTAIYMSEVDKYSSGIVKDRNRLYWDGFKQMPSPYPPPNEQALIADAIQQQTQMVDIAVGQTMREIVLLREYRTRLLADVVMGQVDVRAAAVGLADEGDEVAAAEEMEVVDEDEQGEDMIDDGEEARE